MIYSYFIIIWQVGVVTYGSTAVKQIPLDIKSGNRCDLRSRVNALTLTPGTSNLNAGDSGTCFILSTSLLCLVKIYPR